MSNDKSSEMPIELEKAEFENFRNVWAKATSPDAEIVTNGFFRSIHSAGFDKCYELMKEREQKLLGVISVLKEACEFYGYIENWHYSEYDKDVITSSDVEFKVIDEDSEYYGGRRAREALAKVEEMMRD